MSTLSVTDYATLAVHGFTQYRREDILSGCVGWDVDEAFQRLLDAFVDLPEDPYAEGTHRYRRYGRAVVVPWDQSLTWLPTTHDPMLGEVTEYYQGNNNPEFPGARRRFPAIRPELQSNLLLRRLIMFDAGQTECLEQLRFAPVHVGVHFVKLLVDRPDVEAVSSPNVLHQDGEPFTFAHLISRDNVSGGVNAIAPPRCAGLLPHEVRADLLTAQFTLTEPLASYAVYDSKVSHYVSPVRRGPADRPGERCMLLIDFTPFVPQI